MLVLDERHRVRVVLVLDDEDALTRVQLTARVSATRSGPGQSREMVRFAGSNRVRRPVSYDMVAMMLAMAC